METEVGRGLGVAYDLGNYRSKGSTVSSQEEIRGSVGTGSVLHTDVKSCLVSQVDGLYWVYSLVFFYVSSVLCFSFPSYFSQGKIFLRKEKMRRTFY